MASMHFGRPDAMEFEALVQAYSDHDLAKITRSTVPLLDYWRKPDVRLEALGAALGTPLVPDAQLRFEYPVPSVGRAKASYTDLMVLADGVTVAVEAKWTEPRYDTVGEWLAKGDDPGFREEVRRHWLGLISPHSRLGERVVEADVSGCVYQALHRIASACSTQRSGGRVDVVYQVFRLRRVRSRPHYEQDLRDLARAIRPSASLRLCVQRVTLSPRETYREAEEICKGLRRSDERAAAARSALLNGPLFDFGEQPVAPVQVQVVE